ncbi:type VI secretion system tip protein VgrG [Fodinibius salsisoli]|uniref:Type VI secretion system tip protein VgrG n=1 Tax=Fodinibius salsisoli TaxID=2820877 RepID=A0ABT3PQM4_9BACT|nr:type VI secretion system tip protein VgrG [Fodinibius salsisoli]MCW9708160.1 type VI secretion system tip protein VgrG [Fodinibius salsisoli]
MPETRRTIPADRPTDFPTFEVLSDGTKLPKKYHVFSFTVSKSINRISYAELTLKDGDPAREDFPLSNTDLFKPGTIIEIKAGYHNENKSIFKGIVIKHGIKARDGRPSMLTVECKDEAVKMTNGRQNRYFTEVTDSEVFEELIDAYGLTAEVENTSETHKEMVQYYATDWDFLLARAEMNSQCVLADDGTLIVQKPSLEDSTLTLTYGATILDFEAEMDARDQQKAISSSSWDYTTQEVVESEAEAPTLQQAGNISEEELADVIGSESVSYRHSGQVGETELQAWADAAMLKSRLAKIRGRVRCKGYPEIKPFDTIELAGMGERFNGKVFVSGVRQNYSTDRWVTDIEFGLSPRWFYKENDVVEQPASGLLPAVNGLQVGVVTQLQDDPAGEDRVLVKLPVLDAEHEGIWTRVSTLDAGENRGSFFRPEIGDEVLVGFINDDPRDPVILGMMNSSAKPAPAQGSDDNHEKGFVTREELRLWFNDEKKSIALETPNGNKITLSDDEGSIMLEDENGNTVTMSSDGISLESAADIVLKAGGNVNIEGVNVEQKASAQFKAEGSAGAEVSTSGTAVLKGSIVQIN